MLIAGRFAASQPKLPDSDDMRFYADWAMRIASGKWTDGQAFYGLPGYPFCLAAIFHLTQPDQFYVSVIQALFDSLTALLIFKIARELFSISREANDSGASHTNPEVIGSFAAFVWIVYQPAQTFSVILMPTAWLVLAFWSSVWVVIRTRVATAWWPWFGLGLCAGLMALMVATILFLIPLFVVAAALTVGRPDGWKFRVPRIALSAAILFAGVFLGTSPAWLHNYFVAKDPVMLSAHSGLNFWMGNNPEATGYPKIPDGLSAGQEGLLRDSITRAEEEAGRKLKRSEVSKYWSGKAGRWVHGNRAAWIALLGVKVRNFWNAFQYDDLSEITLLRETGVLTPGLRFGIVAALGLPGMLIASIRFRRARWVAAAVLLHMCALLPVFITERYRLCAVPGLAIFAAFVVWEIWGSLSRSRWLGLLGILALVAASSWFVSLPQRDPALWALDPFNTGLKHLRAGRLDLAQQKLDAAHRLVPDNSEINFGLGNLWFAKGDTDRARGFYRRAIELSPRHTGALNNLARVETLARNWDEAEQCLRASIAVDPASVKSHFLLAEMEFAKGDLIAARAALAKAFALRPDQPELIELQHKLDASPAP